MNEPAETSFMCSHSQLLCIALPVPSLNGVQNEMIVLWDLELLFFSKELFAKSHSYYALRWPTAVAANQQSIES